MAGKILIVSEDPAICQSISAVARAAAIQPIVAFSLEKARDMARTEKPNLAVCDEILADGPGFSLLKELRTIGVHADVILLTSGTRMDLVVEGVLEGAADFLSHPFTSGQLTAVLHRVMKAIARRRMEPEGGAGSALVIEDETISLRAMGNYLADMGMSSFQVSTLDEARVILATGQVEVVITDVFLENDNGLDLVEELRRTQPDIPSVVVTSSATQEIAVDAIRRGARSVLLKPLDRKDFQNAVTMARRDRRIRKERLELMRRVSGFEAGFEHLHQEMVSRGTRPSEVSAELLPHRVVRSLGSALVMFDHDARVIDLNPSAERVLGCVRADVLRRPLEEVKNFESFREAILECLATGQSFQNLEAQLVFASVRRIVGYSVAPLIGAADPGVVLNCQDITARRRLTEMQRQTERLASTGLLLAGVSTEIASPLQVALGHADLVARYEGIPETLTRSLEKLRASIQQASEFASRLVQMMRTERGSRQPVDLHQSLRAVLRLLDRTLQVGGHAVELELDDVTPTLIGDAAMLQNLFVTLVNNACARMPGGGIMRIKTAMLTGVVEIMVRDRGLGLPTPVPLPASELAESIGQADAVGRHLVNGMVERSGGTMHVEAIAGRGTTVTVRLPLPDGRERERWAVPAPSVAVSVGRVGPGKAPVILIAAASTGGDTYRTWLESAGRTVLIPTGIDAIPGLVEANPGCVVIVDATQGHEGDLATLRRLNMPQRPPVIVVVDEAVIQRRGLSLDVLGRHRIAAPADSAEVLLRALLLAELDRPAPETTVQS